MDSAAGGPCIFVSAAEPSGDLHAAALIQALSRRLPSATFVGLAGPRMREAGCRTVHDLTTHSAMLLSAIANAGRALDVLSRVDRLLASRKIAAAVLIDSPTLNLPIARRAKARQLPVFYYIAPQVWAWAEFRINKIRRCVDRLAAILPFEQEYFRSRGIDATYVGHPLFDRLTSRRIDPDRVAQLRDSGSPVVALLPGSRRQVVREVLPGQLDVVSRIKQRYRQTRVLLSVANRAMRPTIEHLIRLQPGRTDVCTDHCGELLEAADLVLVASGTATLEVAYHHKPMIVMYNHSRWAYSLIGRRLITTEYLSLPNILAGRQIVPEFMPYYRSTQPIATCALELLAVPQRSRQVAAELAELIDPLAKPGASARAAELLTDLLQARSVDQPRLAGSRARIW